MKGFFCILMLLLTFAPFVSTAQPQQNQTSQNMTLHVLPDDAYILDNIENLVGEEIYKNNKYL